MENSSVYSVLFFFKDSLIIQATSCSIKNWKPSSLTVLSISEKRAEQHSLHLWSQKFSKTSTSIHLSQHIFTQLYSPSSCAITSVAWFPKLSEWLWVLISVNGHKKNLKKNLNLLMWFGCNNLPQMSGLCLSVDAYPWYWVPWIEVL